MVTKTATKTAKPAPSAKPSKPTKTVGTRKKALTPRRAAKPAGPALAKPLSAREIVNLLKVATQAKSIELKLSVPFTGHRAAIMSIGFDVVEMQPREIYFFDTPDLALYRAGMAVRARRTQGGSADSVIKVRPVDPANVDKRLRVREEFKIEVDAMPGGFVCSASFKGVCDSQAVLDVSSGALPLRRLFSKEQRAFYDAQAPAGITLDKLVALGPTFMLKARHKPKEYPNRIVVETWFYPDGSRILEISTKCPPGETFRVVAEFKAYLAGHGIALGEEQSAKTRTTLEFFSARLKKKGQAG